MKTLLQLLFLLISIIAFSSCAALIDNKAQDIRITTNFNNAKINYNDSIYNLPTNIRTDTKRESVKLFLILDNTQKEFYIYDKKNNRNFIERITMNNPEINYLNIFKGACNKFPNRIYFDKNDTALITDYYKINDIEKVNYKALNLYVGLPTLNFFSIYFSPDLKENLIGLLGISAGIEYFYNINQAIGVDARFTINNSLPIISREFNKRGIDIFSASIFHNSKYRMFDIRYGMTYSYNKLIHKDDQILIYTNRNTSSIGAFLSISTNFNSLIKTAITYLPTFYHFSLISKFYRFNNLLSLEFQYQMQLYKY